MALRERLGREASPSATVLDGQTVKSAGKGRPKDDAVGQDPGKGVTGRKIHALIDTGGLALRGVAHPAGIQDRDGAARALSRIRSRLPRRERRWGDAGYYARQVEATTAEIPVLSMEIVGRSGNTRGFVVQPRRRWVVERTFPRFGRDRRLAKDGETLADTLAAFLALSAIRDALKRLARLARALEAGAQNRKFSSVRAAGSMASSKIRSPASP